MQDEFVSEPIKPIEGTFDAAGMAHGEPGLPSRFIWREKEYAIAEVLEKWKESGRCKSGSSEMYLRKHWFKVKCTDGLEMTIYFERQPKSKQQNKMRWWLYTVSSDIKASMFEYYNERAEEYEELYTLGKGPASIPDPEAYKAEVNILAGIAGEFCYGAVIDIACGTGFWLPYYVRQCSHVTLIDRSAKMLSVCKKKVSSLEVQDKCNLICDDFLAHQFDAANFDCAVIGFFISHLSQKEEQEFFEKLKSILKSGGNFLIFDSTWNEERAKTREKQGKHQRKLNDGRTFDIYKRYFDESDIKLMAKEYQLPLSIEHLGRVFVAVSGRLR